MRSGGTDSAINRHTPQPPTCSISSRAVLLTLNCFAPRPYPSPTSRKGHALEDESGILGKLFFAWINPILLRGYGGLLLSHDLPFLSRDLSAKLSRAEMIRSWNRRGQSQPYILLFCVSVEAGFCDSRDS